MAFPNFIKLIALVIKISPFSQVNLCQKWANLEQTATEDFLVPICSVGNPL
jgi:hypothetical protein